MRSGLRVTMCGLWLAMLAAGAAWGQIPGTGTPGGGTTGLPFGQSTGMRGGSSSSSGTQGSSGGGGLDDMGLGDMLQAGPASQAQTEEILSRTAVPAR